MYKSAPFKLWKSIISYLIVASYLFFEMGVQVSPSVMTNQLQEAMGIGAFGLGVMSSFYFYSYTMMQLPAGLLFDIKNPRVIITLSILICACGCFIFGLSGSVYSGAFARLLTGCGSAFAFVAVLVVTAHLFPHRYFAFITGVTQMLAALGAMSGQMPLSYAIAHFGWRNTQFLLALVGVFLALFVWIVLEDEKKNAQKTVFSEHKTKKKQVFVLHFLQVLREKQTWLLSAYAFLLWAPMSGFASLWGVPFLEKVYNLSSHQAALICSLMWLGLALASPFLGWISTFFQSRKWPLSASALVGGIAFLCLLLLSQPGLWILAILVFFAGAGCSGQALSFTAVKESHRETQRATAISFNNMAVVLSGAVFQPVLGKLISHNMLWASHSGSNFFRYSMLVVFFAYLVAFLLASVAIRETFKKA